MQRLGTVLGIWAHPDDDIYLSAGLMASAIRAGERVVDVTATHGEGGSMDEERWPPATMGEIRTSELLRSLDVLGVTEHLFLDGPVDVDMDAPLDERGADQVRRIMADISPDTVLTFGPEGMTGHRGHQDVSRWVTEAFHEVARPGARLLYATYTPSWHAEWVEHLLPFDIFRPGTPPCTPEDELAISFGLPDDLLDLKLSAIKEHASQVEALLRVFGDDGFRRVMAVELFRLGATKEDR